MSLNSSRIRTHKTAIFVVVFAAAALTFGYFGGPAVRRVLAGRESAAAVKFAVPAAAPGSVSVETPRSPWIKLREGKAANSEFSGSPAAIARFQAGSLRPVSLASADVNGDGFPDLISGFAGPDGGVVTIQRGAKQAFAPDDPQVLAGIRNGEFPASFEKEAFTVDVPGSPDYLFTGRFLSDSPLALAVAARGSRIIYIYPINEKGMLGSPVSIDLGGDLTAAAADTFDPAKGFTGIVAATGTEGAASLVIFDGTVDVTATKGRSVAIAHPADSLILRSPDGLTPEKDLFILGGGSVSRLPAIGKAGSGIENIDLPFTAVDFAAGEFIRDRRARTELAVLADNGSIYYLANGSLDRRPFTEDEMRAAFAKNGRGRTVVVDSTDTASALANNWTIAEQQDLGLVNLVRPNAQPLLRRAYITGNETDDLLVVDPSTNHAKVLFKEPVYGPNRLAFTGDTQVEDLGFASPIAAALPIRLNVMGQQGIAVLEDGKLEATPVLFAPQATFTVSKTADTADGVCNADCSLREAVVAANAAAGADLVTFSPNGTFQLTIPGAGENTASTGDIDVTQSLTITGNGAANSILQGGSTNANGIDKVLSINPTFTSAFATSITGVTVRWGRNPSSYATDGFGGGFDWEGSGTGTLSVANSTVNDNHTLDGDGGGITATNSVAGAGTFTVAGSTISANSPARAGVANSPVGGGIFVGTTTPYLITNTTITGNFVTGSGGQGQGGGLFAFGPGGSGGNSFLTSSTVSNNTAPSDAGGVYSTQRVDVNAPATISGNSSGRFGGGLFINHPNATSTITKATITGNSATTTGSGIYLGTTTTANVLNLSYSRIVGNTGVGITGLISAGGTANAANNWWGCNTGPSAAPCNTTGTATGGVVTSTPYLQLRNTAATSPILIGQTSALTASFLLNSAGSAVSASNLDVLIGLPVTWGATLGNISGSQATIQAAGTATATYTGTSAGPGTATATVDSGPAVANITVNTPTADLAITKTDGVTTATAGGSVTYTITASNAGPNGATGATVADTFPASLTGTWTCVGAGGGTCTASGSGNINDTVNLPAGGSVTYTVSASLSAAATGSLSNTATVAAPGGTTDPTPGNNSATDTDTIVRSADLAITKTDGVTSVTPGGSTTYTITASNAGPSNATGATVADTFPASLTATWTCVGAGGGTCTASGSGNINDTVNLPAGGSVTYTASASISASATGSLSNTATVAAPAGVTDPTPGNNSATDTDTIVPSADLAITKTDGVTSVTAGGSTTYTITASNAGPSPATGAAVADTFPASLTGTWTCVGAGGGTCTASGSGNISDTVNLPAGGSVTYTVSATISAAATGSLSNTATVAAPGGTTDPTPGNNSATDTDTIVRSADLAITKTDGVTTVTAGGSTTYTITASNAGPSNATGATVADTFPASLTGTWTCVGAGGGTCTASGSGNINDTVNLPSGGSVTYTVSTAISAAATGSLSNTATVAAPAGVTDPTPGNNSATDTDTIGASADLAITKTDGVTNVLAGTATTYTITASNAGPSNAPGSTVGDTFAASIASATWTCVGAGGGTCTASGSGNINDTVNLPAGGSVTYTVTANVAVSATGSLVNTATVTAAGGVTDPTPGNNSATDTDTITPSDTVLPTAAATLTNVNSPGGTLYTFTVTYADNVAVNVSTLDNNDIVVTGPNAFTTPATFVGVDVNTNGSPRVATYSFVPPGGTWDQADNGTYTVTMQASQVADTNGNFVNGGSLGTFTAVPLVLVVDRTDDTVVSACTAAANDCTLRGAIAAANAAPTADTINFDPTVFATPQTITLGGTEIVITNSGGLTVNGPGADKLTVSGNGTSRIFTNSPSAVTTISGMRLTGGTGTGATGTGRGGAVYNTGGTLTLNGLVVTGNTSTNGAALTNATAPATLNVVNCWIFGNATPGSGGAIQNFSGATVVTNVINSSITGNTANSSTVGGGAIQANGTVTVTNSTIGGNTAVNGSGGGIYFNGTALTVTNSTIAGNTSANNGGGIHNTTANPPNVRNSIIAGNNGIAASPDVTSVYASNGNNIIGNVGTSTGWVGTDLQNTDPLLAPLGFYGGNGYSFALTSASPAVNGGQDCVLTLTCTGPNPASAITLDQRGAARIGSVDIGSFELNNSANGGNFVALLPNALQGTAYNFVLAPVNGAFSQAVTAGSLPDNILLNSGAAATFSGTPTLSGVYPFSVTATGGANSNVTDYRLVVFAPPATLVSVGGRVSVASGGGVKGVNVILTDSLNNSYFARTSPLGYYRIDNVPAGATYTLSISSKRFEYTPSNLTVNYNLTNTDLVVTPIP